LWFETAVAIVAIVVPIVAKQWRDSKKLDEKLGMIVDNQKEIVEVQTEVHGFTKLLNHWSDKLEHIANQVVEIKTYCRMCNEDKPTTEVS